MEYYLHHFGLLATDGPKFPDEADVENGESGQRQDQHHCGVEDVVVDDPIERLITEWSGLRFQMPVARPTVL